MHHHRADDGPAYLTILIVGHVMGFALHGLFGYMRDDPLILALVLCTIATVLALLMLPRMKGLMVGPQAILVWVDGRSNADFRVRSLASGTRRFRRQTISSKSRWSASLVELPWRCPLLADRTQRLSIYKVLSPLAGAIDAMAVCVGKSEPKLEEGFHV
nr:DUF983 domain-containing protein [Marivivens donghaensis]